MHPLFLAPTTLMDAAPRELIDAAAQAGYDGVGLRLHPSPKMPYHPVVGNSGLIRDMKAMLADADLRVLDVLAFYLQPDCDFDNFLPALELAAEFGAHYALVQGDDADWARLRDNFGRLCDLAKGYEMRVAVEFVPSRPLCTLALAAQLLDEAQRANAVICVDPLHLIRSGGQPSDLIGLDARLLPYAQISDGVLGRDEPDLTMLGRMPLGQRRLPGAGTLPLREIITALPANIALSVEVLQPKTGAHAALSAREWAKLTLDSSRKFLQ